MPKSFMGLSFLIPLKVELDSVFTHASQFHIFIFIFSQFTKVKSSNYVKKVL